MTFIHDIVTDEYGQSYDLIEVEAAVGFALGLALTVIKAFWHIDFEVMSYAGGLAAMVTATAASRRIKPPAIPMPQNGGQ